MQSIQNLTEALTGVVAEHAGSIVHVSGRRGHGASGVVWSDDGVILTAAHVVPRGDSAEVRFEDGSTATAEVAGRDRRIDLAVLRVDATGLPEPQWAAGLDELKVGAPTLTLTRPGRTHRAAFGVVAALVKDWRAPGGGRLEHYLEIDTLAQRGFSGGLLVAPGLGGIGMVTSGLLRRRLLAIPPQTLHRVVPKLLAKGSVKRGYLGVALYPVEVPAALQDKTGTEIALVILSVQADSPADQAGVLLGDVLFAIDETTTEHPRDVVDALEEKSAGDKVTLKLLRGGESNDIEATVGTRP